MRKIWKCSQCMSTRVIEDSRFGRRLTCQDCGSHAIGFAQKGDRTEIIVGLKYGRNRVILAVVLGVIFGLPILSKIGQVALPCQSFASEAIQEENLLGLNMYDKGVRSVDYGSATQLGGQDNQSFKSKSLIVCSVNVTKDNGQSDKVIYQVATDKQGQSWVRMAQFGTEADAEAKIDESMEKLEESFKKLEESFKELEQDL